ncbi:MAG: S9 family peptidase [Phycisphaeraceae bacterium]|nr:S9 family peptidase [Phycisphaeraceae bacterium]
MTAKSSTATVPLIPRAMLFGYPRYSLPQISPDGKRVAYLSADERGVLQVWLRGEEGQKDRVLTHDPRRGIRSYTWTYLPDRMIYLQDADGDENYHLFLVDVASGQVRDMTPYPGVRAELITLHHEHPDEALVGMNLKDRQRMDVYRISLARASAELDTVNPGNVQSWTACGLKVLAAMLGAEDGGQDLLLRDDTGQPWRVARHWGPDEQAKALSFSKDGRTLYLLANHDADTMRVLAHDTRTGQETVIAHDPEYDIEWLATHPKEKTPQFVMVQRDLWGWIVIDPTIEADLKVLTKLDEGEVSLASRDLADRHWIVCINQDRRFPHYYRYDRQTKQASLLFVGNEELDKCELSRKTPIRVTARDGLTLHGYLTMPAGYPKENLPVVLYVHGGPWMRDGWAFWSTIQWLANRGYAVLQVDYRGSTGYGKKHLNAGNRQWAAKMHDDLIDTVNWVIEKKIADPKRIAIMGASYGGFATLTGLTFTPEVFACGVDLVGPSNIVTLLNTTPAWWKPLRAMLIHRMGDPATEQEFLHSRSPLFKADRITKPLLIGQGANDPRVKPAESEQIVQAMRRANLPVQYVVYTDEGHTLARPENRMHFHALAEEFLAKHLGGRFEPMDEIPGHSGVIQ